MGGPFLQNNENEVFIQERCIRGSIDTYHVFPINVCNVVWIRLLFDWPQFVSEGAAVLAFHLVSSAKEFIRNFRRSIDCFHRIWYILQTTSWLVVCYNDSRPESRYVYSKKAWCSDNKSHDFLRPYSYSLHSICPVERDMIKNRIMCLFASRL